MKRMKTQLMLLTALAITGLITGCAENTDISQENEIMKLEDGFSAVSYEGDYWFDDFLGQGGASSDAGVIDFLTKHITTGAVSYTRLDVYKRQSLYWVPAQSELQKRVPPQTPLKGR